MGLQVAKDMQFTETSSLQNIVPVNNTGVGRWFGGGGGGGGRTLAFISL